MQRPTTNTKTGFTIVELLIVIVVIAILAVISVIAYNGIQNRAQHSAVQASTRQLTGRLEAFFTEKEAYPTSLSDCPTPATENLCVQETNGMTRYEYLVSSTGPGGLSRMVTPGYDLATMNDRAFLYIGKGERERSGTTAREIVQYTDLAPYIDKYGLRAYKLSFDIKSANISQQSTMRVYLQNGNGAKHNFAHTVSVTTEYSHHEIIVTPTPANSTLTQSWLAFYGGAYGSGNIPTVKNVRFELAD